MIKKSFLQVIRISCSPYALLRCYFLYQLYLFYIGFYLTKLIGTAYDMAWDLRDYVRFITGKVDFLTAVRSFTALLVKSRKKQPFCVSFFIHYY